MNRRFLLLLALAVAAVFAFALKARAAVPSSSSSAGPYTCNGTTTVFSVPFRFLANGDLLVQKTLLSTGEISSLAITTDYTVLGAGTAAGGSVVLVAGSRCRSGYTLTIRRATAKTQPRSLRSSSSYNAAAVEDAVDRVTMIAQEMSRDLDPDTISSAAVNATAKANAAAQSAAAAQAAVSSAAVPGTASLVIAEGSSSVRTIGNRAGDIVNLKDFGALCDGATNDATAVASAISQIGSAYRTLVVSGDCVVDSNVTIPPTIRIRFENSGRFSGSGAVTYAEAGTAEATAGGAVVRGQVQVPVKGARQARALGLRSVLLNRRQAGTADYMVAAWGYAGGFPGNLYLRDFVHQSEPFPGFFTSTYLRALVDTWATSYDGTSVASYAVFNSSGTVASFGRSVPEASSPTFDNASYFGILLAQAIERGDTTAWSTHGTLAKTVLGNVPRSAGLAWTSATPPNIGWGFHDRVPLTGGLAMASAHLAYAYQRLYAVTGDGALRGPLETLIGGLRSLRRSDGYYNASTGQAVPDTVATALIAAMGLCSPAEAARSGRRLADDYRSGLISQRGGIRWMPAPNYWPTTNPVTTQGTYQNGGYWPGEWTWWVAKAMLAAGRTNEATALLQDAADELLAEHRVNKTEMKEWYAGSSAGQDGYGASVGWLIGASDPGASDLVVYLPTTASASVITPVPFHDIDAVEVLAPSASTATVTISAAQRTTGTPDYGFSAAYGSASQIAAVSLAAETAKAATSGLMPAAPFGGYVKTTMSSGSTTQPLAVRMGRYKGLAPKLISYGGNFSDTFAADNLTTNYVTASTSYAVAGGRLKATVAEQHVPLFVGRRYSDVRIQADVIPTTVAVHSPALLVRSSGPSSGVYAQLNTGQVTVYQAVNGVTSVLGTISTTVTDGVAVPLEVELVSTAVTVTANGTDTGTFLTTLAGVGMAGVMVTTTIPGTLNAGEWDNLVVTDLGGTQRTFATDGLTPYTATGTWSIVDAHLVTTDATDYRTALYGDVQGKDIAIASTFSSSAWATRPTGLAVRAVDATNMIYAVANGTNVLLYDRASSADTLLLTIPTAIADGADLTMELRVAGSPTAVSRITITVGGQRYQTYAPRVAGASSISAGFVARGTSGTATFKTQTVTAYGANPQPVPIGYVLENGMLGTTWTTDDTYTGNVGTVVLRDGFGTPVVTYSNADNVSVAY